MRERHFGGFSLKATVQAAMGAVPLTLMIGLGMDTLPGEADLGGIGLEHIDNKPLGAIAVALSAERCLK